MEQDSGFAHRTLSWLCKKLSFADVQWPDRNNSIRNTAKLSLVNFIIFFGIYIVLTYMFWPKYYDQFQTADIYTSFYETGKYKHDCKSEDCSNLISNIIQLPQDFYRSILLSCSAKSQSKLTEFCNNENSTVSLALNEIYEKYYYNFVHYKSYSEYKSEFQRVNTTDYFTIEWIKRSDKKMSISLSNNKMVISGDFINIDHKTNSKSIQIKELIEMTLLSTGVLEPVQQLAADFLSSRKLNIKVKIPFSHFTIKHDIETLFKKEIRSISTKLPYFSLINLSTRIVASYPTGTILLDDVRDQLMKEFPDDHLSLSIYLTNNPINEFSFVETNDRKYGIIHGLKDLDSNKINELLSYFVLKILNIIPNKLLYIKAAQINIDLNISKNYLGNELSNFKKREVDAKRYIMLYQLAATGWIKDKYLTADILNKAEQKSYK